jgi:hypothetical protein
VNSGKPQAELRLASWRVALAAIALFAVNAAVCLPLFGINYLDEFQSNEGSFITFGRFLAGNWPHAAWFPWYNAGMPFENTYMPLLPALVAILARVTHASPAHLYHILMASAYSAAPAALFLFAAKLAGRLRPGLLAGLAWSLFSPSLLIPSILADSGSAWDVRRLKNIVFYGEGPHNLALCLLPIALLLLARYLDKPGARRFAAAAAGFAVVAASNAFGMVVAAAGAAILFAARGKWNWRELPGIAAVLAAAYLLIGRVLPPSLLRLIETNSQMVGGDYRFTIRAKLLAVAFALAWLVLWLLVRRRGGPLMRFAVLFLACFGGIAVLADRGIGFLPQPMRYHLEMEVGVCLVVGVALDAVFAHMGRIRTRLAAACVLVAAFAGLKDYEYARRLIRPVDVAASVPFRQARWIGEHLPGQRIMVAGENQYWFNLFADNPQLSAGHEPSAPNWIQRVAVYTIYSGQNAGLQDGPISVLWLKAFGCGAVTVPGPRSRDHYHPIVNWGKFDGLLPVVWRDQDDFVYQVPLRSASLAHVVPRGAVVTRPPIHGLDIEGVRSYVAALEDPSIPPAELTWENAGHGRIAAAPARGQVISVQITYDPGWQASVDGRPVAVRPDGLGLMVIEPGREGKCTVDLRFGGGTERTICLVISLAAGILVIGLGFRPARHPQESAGTAGST